MSNPEIVIRTISSLKPNPRNARTHSKRQIQQIAESIKAFGMITAIVIDEAGTILAGHGRVEAAKLLGLEEIPTISVSHLSEQKKRAFMLADNRIAANAGWDRATLSIEFSELPELLALEDLSIEITGFPAAETDEIITDFDHRAEPTDQIPSPLLGPTVSQHGDIWQLGKHRLMVGNARSPENLQALLNGVEADMVWTDPPYNVKIRNVVGRGKIRHEEFQEASGEMESPQFVEFLMETLGNAAKFSRDGAVHFVTMDWRHAKELMCGAEQIYGAHLNTAVWVKTTAGQGSFYRSKHEFVFVYRVGGSSHRNNVELGRYGRTRTNVWEYPGANTFRKGRIKDLRSHPTVKPVGLVADCIKDVTTKDEAVLDIFAGSGTTILACEKTGRRGYALEIEPGYVDIAIQRWQEFTGADAVNTSTQRTFEEQSHIVDNEIHRAGVKHV